MTIAWCSLSVDKEIQEAYYYGHTYVESDTHSVRARTPVNK